MELRDYFYLTTFRLKDYKKELILLILSFFLSWGLFWGIAKFRDSYFSNFDIINDKTPLEFTIFKVFFWILLFLLLNWIYPEYFKRGRIYKFKKSVLFLV